MESLEDCDTGVGTSRSSPMERLIGTPCYLGYVATSKKKVLGVSGIHNGWISYIEEATRRDFSIVWIRMVLSSTYVPSKVTLEEQWLIVHYCTMFKFHLDGQYLPRWTFQNDVFRQAGRAYRGWKRRQRRTADGLFLQSRPHEQRARREVPRLIGSTKGTQQKQVERINLRKAQDPISCHYPLRLSAC